MIDERNEQWRIAAIALEAAGSDSFALAGSGAIREHGLIDRPTEDIDLFTVMQASQNFDSAVDQVIQSLRSQGYNVDEETRSGAFARLLVSEKESLYSTEIDMGVDWRSSSPVTLSIGPVLAIRDAVGNKVAALFSRGEARDYLDFDAIRQKGLFSDSELINLARNADPGFDLEMFKQRLEEVDCLEPEQVERYGYTPADLDTIKQRLKKLSRDITKGKIAGQPKSKAEFLASMEDLTQHKLNSNKSSSYRNQARDGMQR